MQDSNALGLEVCNINLTNTLIQIMRHIATTHYPRWLALPRDTRPPSLRLAALPPTALTFGADSAFAAAEADDNTLRLLVRRSLLAEAGEARFRLQRVPWDWDEDHDPRSVREARRQLADWHADLTKVDFVDGFGVWWLNLCSGP